MKDTLGFPLEISVMICREKGWYIDWLEFLVDAGRLGHSKFSDAVSELEILSIPGLSEIKQKFIAVLQVTPGKTLEEQCQHIYNEKRANAAKIDQFFCAIEAITNPSNHPQSKP